MKLTRELLPMPRDGEIAVISFPGRLSADMAHHLRVRWDEAIAAASAGKAAIVVLENGARLSVYRNREAVEAAYSARYGDAG